MSLRPAVRRLLALSLVTVAACGGSYEKGEPVVGVSPHATSSLDAFEFHSAPWVNLHLVLYGLALKQTGHLKGGGGGNGLSVLDGIDVAALKPAEVAAWQAAVDFYARTYADRDPTFDDGLIAIQNSLVDAGSAHDLAASGLAADLTKVLEPAMAVYRAHFWAADDRVNRAWMDTTRVALGAYGAPLVEELRGFYHQVGTRPPLRVDVVRFATWGGAYSTLGPDRVTLAAPDPRNALPAGLESLLHEASHTMIRPVRDALDHELDAQHKSARGLWHALLFYTTGYVVQEHVAGYVPYAVTYGLYEGTWQPYRVALEAHWRPYLQGKASFDAAIHDLVATL